MFAINNGKIVIHFVGIGGIGMSGIAEITHSLGYIVQGSDKTNSQNTDRLTRLGIKVIIGHDASNVDNANVVVYSSAIKQNNPELIQAKKLRIPCLTRAEMLSQIVRFKKSVVVAGSHGKTTVTSLCASVLEMASFHPTVVNGGIIHSYNSNAKLGTGDWAVIESDESDGSFTQFFPTVGIITNIDKEHMTHYGNFENLKNAFKTFLYNTPFFGAGVVCVDDPNICDIVKDMTDRKIITYSISQDSMFKATNIRKSANGSVSDVLHFDEIITDVSIPLLGDHNIRNSLSVIAMANELGIDINTVKSTLSSYTGVNRRFTIVGKIYNTLVVDDYAHHPTEIKSLLNSARQKVSGKIILIHQPHRFTRLNTLFNEFCNCFDMADTIIITPVYKADDIETAPITADNLYEELTKKNDNVFFANDRQEIQQLLLNMTFAKDDIILFSGAGSISKWAHDIVRQIGQHI